jgi:riboflavin synthase
MFTGIIETTGIVQAIYTNGSNKTFTIQSNISQDLKVDQSVSHNGVCLTVESITAQTHTVTAIAETLQKTDLNNWQTNDVVNIERCLLAGSRIDGHFVQGHVDATAICTHIKDEDGSWLIEFSFDEDFAPLLIEKGSVAINGISLTCFNVTESSFNVAIIPYTWQHTNMQYLQIGERVNIEFDVFGKYMQRFYHLLKTTTAQ